MGEVVAHPSWVQFRDRYGKDAVAVFPDALGRFSVLLDRPSLMTPEHPSRLKFIADHPSREVACLHAAILGEKHGLPVVDLTDAITSNMNGGAA